MRKLLHLICIGTAVMFTMGFGCNDNDAVTGEVPAHGLVPAGQTATETIAAVEEPEAPEAPDTLAAARNRRWVDSLMNVEVALPSLFDEKKAFDTVIIATYQDLSKKTGGEMKIVATADKLQQNIFDVLCKNNRDGSDILFMIDNSGSMEDDIDAVKKGMRQIIDAIQEKRRIRLAIAIYRDKKYNGDKWFDFRNFETDYEAARQYVDSMVTISNWDTPESVYEAFAECSRKNFWRSGSKRMAIIIGDAAGKVKEDGGEFDAADVVRMASAGRVHVNLFPIIVTPLIEQLRQVADGPVPFTERVFITKLYPNPTTGVAHIEFAEEGLHRIDIYNSAGSLVDQINIDGQDWTLDLGRFPDGLYVIRVKDQNNQFHSGKIVVRH